MPMKKYMDWRGWWEGLYLSWIKRVTDSALTWAGTNLVEKMGAGNIGITWKQALCMFGGLTALSIIRYLNEKPKPDLVTEDN